MTLAAKERSLAGRLEPAWIRALIGVAVVGVAVWSTGQCQGQTGTLHEYEIKAGFVFNILKYVEWPDESRSSTSSVLQIGLWGQIPFGSVLAQVLDGKTLQGRKLAVRQVSDAGEAIGCQVVYIGASEKARLPEILSELKQRPILTIGEVDGFAERGGMVNLVARPNRVAMEINRQMANEARLTLSSQLLKVAKVLR